MIFKNTNGQLSNYSLHCGYIESFKHVGYEVELYHDGCFHVRVKKDKVIKWMSMNSLTCMRYIYTSICNRLKNINFKNEKEVFIIGGAEIYTQAYSRADRLIFTFIEEDFEGDTFFPNFPFEKDFKIVSESRILFSLKENLPYRFVTMERKTIKENL